MRLFLQIIMRLLMQMHYFYGIFAKSWDLRIYSLGNEN